MSNSFSTKTKTAEVANSVDLDEVAHNEPPHLDLQSLNSQYDSLDLTFFEILRTKILSSASLMTINAKYMLCMRNQWVSYITES